MSWLKKYGLEILNIALRVIGIGGPIAASMTNNQAGVVSTVDTLTKIAILVQDLEAGFASAFGPTVKTGAAKMAAARPLVSQVVQDWLKSNFPGTAKIQDQVLFTKAIDGGTQFVVDLMNSLEAHVTTTKIVQTSGPAAPAATPSPVPPVA